jgi:hypothetical protein
MVQIMAGLVLDIWIAFLIRTLVNAWRRIASASWPTHPGKITRFHYRHFGWGCDYGEYRYKYSVDGILYRGIYRDPYFVRRSPAAQRSDSVGSEAQVRVSPADPTKSFLTGF